METLRTSLDVIQKQVEQRQPMTSDALTRSQNASSKATSEEINILVGMVENAKQIHLSLEERGVLAFELSKLGETIDRLKKRAGYVIRTTDYGRISLDVWLKAEPLLTQTEAKNLWDEMFSARQREWERLQTHSFNEEDLMKAGFKEVSTMYEYKWHMEVRKRVERLEKKYKLLRASYYQLPEQAKIDLWTKAVQKGFVNDGDKHAIQILPLFFPRMTEDFEEAIKNNSVQP